MKHLPGFRLIWSQMAGYMLSLSWMERLARVTNCCWS